MVITCGISYNVPYTDDKGTTQLCTLRPGTHNYPMLTPNDLVLAETLRVLRKNRHVGFTDLLPGDSDILTATPEGMDPAEYLSSKVVSKPSPVGRHVNMKSVERTKKEAKAAQEKSNARGTNRKDAKAGGKPAKDADFGSEPGRVPPKK